MNWQKQGLKLMEDMWEYAQAAILIYTAEQHLEGSEGKQSGHGNLLLFHSVFLFVPFDYEASLRTFSLQIIYRINF